MKIKKYSLLKALTFLNLPTVAALWSIFDLRKSKAVDIKILILFISLCAYSFLPYSGMDLVGYYDKYNALINIPLNKVHTEFQSNLAITYLIKIIQLVGLNKEFIPFFVTLLSYSFIALAVKMLVKAGNINEKELLFLVTLGFFAISFINNAVGLRSGLSTSLFFLSLSYLSIKKFRPFFALGILSSLVHVYVVLGFILLFASKMDKANIATKLLILSPLLVLFNVGTNLITSVVTSIFPGNFADYVINSYILDERWGYEANLGWKTKVVSFVFVSLPIYTAWLYVIKDKILSPYYKNFLSMLIIVVFFLWDFHAIAERYKYLTQITVYLMIAISLTLHPGRLKATIYMKLFYAACVLNTFWGLYRYKDVIFDSYLVLLKPFLLIFLFEVDLSALRNVGE